MATNDGNVTLHNVSISDPKLGTLTCTQPVTLVPGGTLTCTGSHTATQADLNAGTYDNTATANGSSPEGQPASDEASLSVPAYPAPHLSLTKNADRETYDALNQVIHYTLVATNDGNLTLTGVSISDPKLGTLTCAQPATLDPGETLTCTGSHTVSQADLDAGKYENTATAAGTPPTGSPINALPASETVDAIPFPHISLTKGTTTTLYDHVSQVITYTLIATNDGNVTLHDVSITDPKLGTLTCTQPVSLAPGATLTCTGSHTVTQADLDAGEYDNTATANGTGPQDQPVSDIANKYVPADQNPHLTLTKHADLASYNAVGQVIHYTLVATNDGNVTLTGVSISDAMFSTLSCNPTQPATLAPNGTLTCTTSHTVTLADLNAGSLKNTANAAGTAPSGTVIEPPAAEVTIPALQNPHITLAKSADPTSFSKVGDVILYTLVATNDGNVTLSNVSISDPKLGTLTCTQPVTLVPGGTLNCAGSHTVTQADLDAGTYHNTAIVNGTEPNGQPVSDEANAIADGLQNPHISLTKATTTVNFDHAGQVIAYTLTATNDGNVTLYNVTISDPKLGTLTCTQPVSSAPGASLPCTGSHTVTQADLEAGKYDNTATVTGKGPQEQPVSATASKSVPSLQTPRIDVEKYVKNGAGVWQDADTVTGPYLNPGVNPKFKFVVTNTGNVTLTGITLVDNMLSLSGCTIPATLAPNASFECLVTGTWGAGQHTNIATAAGSFNSTRYPDSDNANYFGAVPVVSKTANGTYQEVHDWQVLKSVDVGSQNAYAGQKVDFTWTVNVAETTRSENHLVTGVITVFNPNPDDPMSMTLNDVLNDGAVATIGPCTGGTWSSPNLTVPKGGTATCNYSVTPKGDLVPLATALPDTVTMSVSMNGNTYFDITISNGGALNGTYEGWCADPNHGINDRHGIHRQCLLELIESLPAGLVDHPENFDLVNWIINQNFIGKPAGGGLGNYTVEDVQQAIWELLQDNYPVSNSSNPARVAQIKTLAATHEGFTPTCGDLVAVILQPLGGKQISIVQVTFASLGVNCATSNAVLAVVNGFNFPASAEIKWTANPVNPTATLGDDQNSAWPTTISADATFTYKDPQGYTCPADPATYANGPTTYAESNKAILTFSTGSVTSTASTTVKCDAYMPGLSIDKTATPATYSQAGEVIGYSYLVKNTGNVTLAGPVTLTDDKATVTCPAGDLEPDGKMTCSASYTITEADIEYGLVKNIAFASANGTNSKTDTETVELVKLGQTILITTHAPPSAAYNSSFTVAATGGDSGNPVVYSASGACTNVGAVFTMTSSTGTCVVHYNQAGNAGYEAAAEVTEVVNATKLAQVINFTSTAPVGTTIGGSPYTPSATADSSLPVTITVDATASSVCSISGGVVSFIGVGTCVLDADQSGNDNYFAAAQVQQSFTVAGTGLTVTTTAITNAVALATNSVAGQSYMVAFSVTPATSGTPTGNVTVSDGTDTCVGTVGSGMCNLISTTPGAKLITATYAGDGIFSGSTSSAVPHTVIEMPALPYKIYLPLVVR